MSTQKLKEKSHDIYLHWSIKKGFHLKKNFTKILLQLSQRIFSVEDSKHIIKDRKSRKKAKKHIAPF